MIAERFISLKDFLGGESARFGILDFENATTFCLLGLATPFTIASREESAMTNCLNPRALT